MEPKNPLLASMKRQSMVDMILIATVVVIVSGLLIGIALRVAAPLALANPNASPTASASVPAATATAGPGDPTPSSSGPTRSNPVVVPRTPAPTKPPACSSNLLRRVGGKLTYPDGQGASGFVFVFQASNGQAAGSFKIGVSGFWSVPVPPGIYKIQFAPSSGKGEWYNDKPSQGTADGIPVCLGDVNNINAVVA